MGEIFTVADLRRSSWRDHDEEQTNIRFERQKREDAKERALVEQRKQEARKAEAETASANWYDAVDTRIRTHFKDWAWAAIDARINELRPAWWEHEWDVLKDAIGGALGTKAAQVRDGLTRAIEEQQRSFEAKLAEQTECLLASSNSIDEAQGRLREEFKRAIEETVDAFGSQLAALEQRLRVVPGKLPVAKTWRPESVTYQAEFVAHEGSLYQAKTDTAQIPGGSDWVCVARAGRDAVTPSVRGTYDAHKTYTRLDIVEFDGNGYLARRAAPGVPGIPGDGWQLMSRSGRRGPAGEVGPRGRKGERGARGEDAPTIVSWTIDRTHYRAVPTMSNGTQGAVLELRGLFEQYQLETSATI